jgi:hypothetical protein
MTHQMKMYVVEDCSETDGVFSAGTKAKLSIYLGKSIYLSITCTVQVIDNQ